MHSASKELLDLSIGGVCHGLDHSTHNTSIGNNRPGTWLFLGEFEDQVSGFTYNGWITTTQQAGNVWKDLGC